MHLQQTKAASRASGGPQYYFHSIPESIKSFLRKKGACAVVLQTPYGIAKSSFMAVDRDHKLDSNNKPIAGRVGHDRIQQAEGTESIGEAIRHWYGLKKGDFERIEVDAHIHPAGHFILIPTAVTLRGKIRAIQMEKYHFPLSFHKDHQSKLWRHQIDSLRQTAADDFRWAAKQLERIVADHTDPTGKYIKEEDLLRAAGALSLLGLDLSAYVGDGYDCPKSIFKFNDLPDYPCPVEVKKRSKDFNYQVTKYADLPRAVVLCMHHNYVNAPEHVDILAVETLAKYMGS
ncbi:MAG TPA: hypothetical protein VGZ47_21930 [Gemmataceae bacterium]|jgi:hypothetical protein|nr:hypothetical protein [Gemmataceae bacterium]